MKSSEILKEARELLWDGTYNNLVERDFSQTFICISEACKKLGLGYSSRQSLALRDDVTLRIEGFETVNELLAYEYTIPVEEYTEGLRM